MCYLCRTLTLWSWRIPPIFCQVVTSLPQVVQFVGYFFFTGGNCFGAPGFSDILFMPDILAYFGVPIWLSFCVLFKKFLFVYLFVNTFFSLYLFCMCLGRAWTDTCGPGPVRVCFFLTACSYHVIPTYHV